MRTKQAFTLIELLVVVAIVSVLMAILLPVYQAAKRRASETRCASNLRQIHVAVSLYQLDWGDGVSLGRSNEMGLPFYPSGPPSIPQALYECGGRDSSNCTMPGSYEWLVPPPAAMFGLDEERVEAMQDEWVEDLMKYDWQTVIMIDPSHQETCPVTDFTAQRVLGLRLDGGLTWRKRRGIPWIQGWWHD